MKFTPRLDLAIQKATMAHAEQKRKANGLPYIVHPFAVMCIASEATNDEDILIACLLHDVIEDVPEKYPEADMLKDFGERVLSIIKGVTKDKSLPSWQDRADTYLKHLEYVASDESVIVSCSDKIHNLMSILHDYRLQGETFWFKFNAGKERQLWWYESVLCVTSKRLPDLSLNKRLSAFVKEFQGLM